MNDVGGTRSGGIEEALEAEPLLELPAPSRAYGPRFAKAMAFANDKHSTQFRKGSGAPYVTHVLAVASLVGEYGGDEDQAIAALLHDVVEDCEVTVADVVHDFGPRVGRIVELCTDTMVTGLESAAAGGNGLREKAPWKQRKSAHVAKLEHAPPEAKLVVAADKLHNAQSICRDLRRRGIGESVWSRFKAGRDEAIWYFRAMAHALRTGWSHEILDELDAEVKLIAVHGSAAP